ncbi:dual specificity protein phosphatase family protein [Bythopirellula polymerisocia]|uniref:Dual specificity phosphatase, catalytic domain n=1 Tax=Bythopirellula polymerisocia TaxID=2528003 RepID=A0A5C6CYH4_9BACT|nr:dual specificity protein phosphatase family protein [Bythopirellula polymerisocia]TWU28531.1 Dual specificity phosphatase, catalytic domain [Bythopirellula polymerisocia]
MRQVEGYPLCLGNVSDVRNPQSLLTAGIGAVVDLAANESPEPLPRELVHCRFPLIDGAENPAWLLRNAVHTVAALLRADVQTLVYCGAGMSRTPAIAAAALIVAAGCSPAEALACVAGERASDVSPALWDDVQSALA